MSKFIVNKDELKGETYNVIINTSHFLYSSAKHVLNIIMARQEKHKHKISRTTVPEEIVEWCELHCKSYFSFRCQEAFFTNEDDAMFFRLTWG